MTFRTKTILGTCAAMLLGFGSLAAQEKAAPAPMPAPKATPAAPSFHYDAACCDTGCGQGDGGCYAGVELVFMWPNSDHFKAFQSFDGTGVIDTRNFDWDVTLTPRIWVGWKNCDGLGFRIRYWRFDQDADESATIDDETIFRLERVADIGDESPELADHLDFSGFGESMITHTELKLWTLDLEVTKDVEVCGSNLTLGAGIRYVNSKSLFQAAELDSEGFVVDAFQIENKFRAFGPTVSVEARAPLCGLTAIIGLRTSILVTAVDHELTASDTFGTVFKDDADTGLWISEIYLGVEKCFECGCGNISVRAGYEAQYWDNASLSTRYGNDFNQGSPMFLDGFSIGVGISR